MKLREADASDVVAVTELAGHFLKGSIYGQWFGFDPERLVGLIFTILNSGKGIILLAYRGDGRMGDDGREPDPPVGMLAGFILPHEIDGQLVAQELAWWVDENSRTHRVGPYMKGRFEDWARQNGASMIKLVAPHGTNVGRFYERDGYEPLETAWVKRI